MGIMRRARVISFLFLGGLLLGGCTFEGIRSTDFGAGDPPDLGVAVGPTHIVQVTRGIMRVYLTSPQGEVVANVSLPTLVGCPQAEFARVKYDPGVQRWYVLAVQRTGAPWVCLAVSNTSDPTGAFTQYSFAPPTGDFPNNSGLTFSNDKIVITTLLIEFVPGQGTPGPAAWVIDKADLLNGGSFAFQLVMLPGAFMMPATPQSSTADVFLAGFGINDVQLRTISGLPGAITTTLQTIPLTFDNAGPAVPQKNSIDTLLIITGPRDHVFRDNRLWVSATSACTPPGDTQKRMCLRVASFSYAAGTFSLLDNIEYGAAGLNYFYPTITVDPDQSLVVGFGVSASTLYPAFWATGRKTADPANTLRTPYVIAAGQAPYSNQDGVVDVLRWGNYFGAATDPTNQRVSWLTGQYATSTPFVYGTRVEQVANQAF